MKRQTLPMVDLRTARIALTATLLAYAVMQPANAYVDPGTGAMMMQMAAAALAGVAFYFRSFRDWFRTLLRRQGRPATSAADSHGRPSDSK